MTFDRIAALLSRHYGIEEVQNVKRIDRGYVNVSYEVETEKGGREGRYFLRQYKRGIKEEEIKFEHSVIQHLTKKKFELTAGVLHTRGGETYISEFENNAAGKEIFLALFEFLPGEDRYTWDHPACTTEELTNAATAFARYHLAVHDLIPEGRRHEPRMIDLLLQMPDIMTDCAKRAGKTPFDAFFRRNYESILKAIARTQHRLDRTTYEQLPHLPIHCDYHAGNLRFRNGQVAGLFDFDWSKMDARCFDVGLAITYFCSAWEGRERGHLELDRMHVFLGAYQSNFSGTGEIGPLSAVEIACLPHMIQASNLYLVRWAVDDFYRNQGDPEEYLRYLRHHVSLMEWLEGSDGLGKLEKVATESIPSSIR